MTTRFRRMLPLAGAAMLSIFAASAAFADTFPSKPVKLIVAFPPGGGADTIGRLIANKLSEIWGQPVVVENHPGAGGMIGAGVAKSAAPDGYSISIATASTALQIAQTTDSPIELARDFEPITLVATAPMMITVHNDLEVGSFAELVELAKNEPGKLNYGGAGQGGVGQFAGELLKLKTGADMTYISYAGGGPAVTALMGKEVDLVILDTSAVAAQLRAGAVRSLAAAADERFPLLPDVPTAGELGVDDFVVTAWYGMFAPAGTPADIIEVLHKGLIEALGDEDVKSKIEGVALAVTPTTPEELTSFMEREIGQFEEVIAATGFGKN